MKTKNVLLSICGGGGGDGVVVVGGGDGGGVVVVGAGCGGGCDGKGDLVYTALPISPLHLRTEI